MSTSKGYFIYGFTDYNQQCIVESTPVETGDVVQNMPYKGVGILFSRVNGKKIQPTRRNLTAHQRVLEHWVQQQYTVLPVQFGTVAATKRDLQQGTRNKIGVLRRQLQRFEGKRELTLKTWWDESFIYQHLLTKYPSLQKQRDSLARRVNAGGYQGKLELGKQIEQMLLDEGEVEADKIEEEVSPVALQINKGKLYGELMFLNLAILIDYRSEPLLDDLVNQVAEHRRGRVNFKYLGPSPPSSFFSLHLRF